MKITHILVLLLLACPAALMAQTQLSIDEFETKLKTSGTAQLLDVRTPEEYTEGHLKNSRNINYKSADFKEKVSKLDKSKPVFVYCLSGGRSASAANVLHENGFTEVYDMKGGYIKWSSSGKAVEKPKSTTEKGLNTAQFNKIITSEKVVLIDFYAKWCAPCVKMLPTVMKLKEEYKGKAKIDTISYDQNKALAQKLGVDEIPGFLLYKDGKLVKRQSGYLSENEFKKLLDANL